jgi:excisionase family DNA binding protein
MRNLDLVLMDDGSAVLSVAQFAKLFSITRPGVYALLNRGVIKSIRIGHRRLIPATEVDRFMGAGCLNLWEKQNGSEIA